MTMTKHFVLPRQPTCYPIHTAIKMNLLRNSKSESLVSVYTCVLVRKWALPRGIRHSPLSPHSITLLESTIWIYIDLLELLPSTLSPCNLITSLKTVSLIGDFLPLNYGNSRLRLQRRNFFWLPPCAGISLVEWPSRLESQPQLLPSNAHRLDVTISIVPQSNTRLMTLMAPLGSTWNERLQNLLDEGMLDDLLCEE